MKWMFWRLLCVFSESPKAFSPLTPPTAPSPLPIFIALYQKLNCLLWDLFYLLANRWFNSTNFVRTFINEVTMIHLKWSRSHPVWDNKEICYNILRVWRAIHNLNVKQNRLFIESGCRNTPTRFDWKIAVSSCVLFFGRRKSLSTSLPRCVFAAKNIFIERDSINKMMLFFNFMPYLIQYGTCRVLTMLFPPFLLLPVMNRFFCYLLSFIAFFLRWHWLSTPFHLFMTSGNSGAIRTIKMKYLQLKIYIFFSFTLSLF